jgi:4-hydroxy-tetrahydrodipicolinate reductase
MGQTLMEIAPDENMRILAALDEGDSLPPELGQAQVAIDFSVHTATAALAAAAAEAKIPLVIGTTGHSENERETILSYTSRIPIVWAGNYSIGVNLLLYLTEVTANVLGDRYVPEITEIHHRHKIDAPSGTALNLAEAIQSAPGLEQIRQLHGRSGNCGPRPSSEIGIHALRGGEVIGEHSVFWFGESDRIELTHRASDRRIFATGAYHAARWALSQAPGLYSMRDVLGFQPVTP